MTQPNERIIYAMMVLEYLNDQHNNHEFTTGISTGELIWLAHSLLQHGPEGLSEQQQAHLAHLQGDK